jgi:hypothetical protein
LYKSALGGFPALPTVCSSFAYLATVAVSPLTAEARSGNQAKRYFLSKYKNRMAALFFSVCCRAWGGVYLGSQAKVKRLFFARGSFRLACNLILLWKMAFRSMVSHCFN